MNKHNIVRGVAAGAVTAALVLAAIQAYGIDGESASANGRPATGTSATAHDSEAGGADLDALAARISADMDRWDGTFAMRQVSVDRAGFVSVGVDKPEKAEPILKKAFGGKHIKVEQAEQSHLY